MIELKRRVFAQELRLSKTSLTTKFLKRSTEIPLSQISGLTNQKIGEGDYSIIFLNGGRNICISGSKNAKEMLEAISEVTGVPIVNKERGSFSRPNRNTNQPPL